MPLGLEISCKTSLLFKNIFSCNLFFEILITWLLRVAYLGIRLLEKWIKALQPKLEGSWFKPRPCYKAPSDLGLKYVSNTVINVYGVRDAALR